MFKKYYNNSILITNPSSRNRIANFKLINYIKEIVINKDKKIIKKD